MIMRRLSGFISLVLFLSSCSIFQSQNTEDISVIATQEVQNSSPTIVSSPTFTLSPTDTATPAPTPTEPPTSTPIPTPTPGCTNQAEFLRHLSIPDNVRLLNDTYFAKVWRVKNSGTCTWDENYRLVFASGEMMASLPEIPLPQIVNPGDTVDIKVILMSPKLADTYTSTWMLQDPNGTAFGWGENGDQPLSLTIQVEEYKKNKRKEAPEDCG